MPKNKLTLFDKQTGKALIFATEDTFNKNLVLMLPAKDGTLALIEDMEFIKEFFKNNELISSDSKKLNGKDGSLYALTDMSNLNFNSLSTETLAELKGYTGSFGYTGSKGDTGYVGSRGDIGIGYTGSKGETGEGLKITAIYNSVTELLAGTTTEETFGLVAGTLSKTEEDYGKLYLRKNNAWTYITDLSVEGAAGIQGPIGPIGYTGSRGDSGIISTSTPSGGKDGDTWYQY